MASYQEIVQSYREMIQHTLRRLHAGTKFNPPDPLKDVLGVVGMDIKIDTPPDPLTSLNGSGFVQSDDSGLLIPAAGLEAPQEPVPSPGAAWVSYKYYSSFPPSSVATLARLMMEAEAPSAPEPDFEVNMMEALVGWKAWRIEFNGLMSIANEILWWPDNALQAKCKRQRGCDSPAEHCTCGIYAGDGRPEAQEYCNNDYPNNLVGEVYGWGKYVRGADGWRCQFAYPKCFYLRKDQAMLIEPLRRYHVPIYIEQPVLMYTPEEDGYEHWTDEEDRDLRAAAISDTTEDTATDEGDA